MIQFTQVTEVNLISLTNYNFDKLGVDAIYEVIITECENYYSTTILKPATFLAEVIKLNNKNFFKMMPNKKHPVLNCTCA